MAESFVACNGSRVWACRQGSGIPILLCNGGPGSCDYLGPVASMLDDIAQVIRFEQRGCGRSDPAGPYDLHTCIADIECIREHYGLEAWVVGGHSWGANLALAYALEHPQRIRGLAYIAGNGAQHDLNWREAYKRARAEQGEVMPEMPYPGNDAVNRDGNTSWYAYIKRPDFLARVSRVKASSLFMFGTRDVRPSWPAEQLANLICGSQQVLIDGAAHYIWLTHAEEMRAALRRFLQNI